MKYLGRSTLMILMIRGFLLIFRMIPGRIQSMRAPRRQLITTLLTTTLPAKSHFHVINNGFTREDRHSESRGAPIH